MEHDHNWKSYDDMIARHCKACDEWEKNKMIKMDKEKLKELEAKEM